MHELEEKTMDTLVTNAEPGVRAIIILINDDCKTKLLQTFASVALPYSR